MAIDEAVHANERLIRKLLGKQAAAWNSGDAAAWSEDFAADADFINVWGMHFQGKAEVERRHAEVFATILKGSKVEVSVWKVRILGPEASVAETLYEVRGFARLPPGLRPTSGGDVLQTRMKYVFSRVDGKWLIVSAQNTAIAPPPGGD